MKKPIYLLPIFWLLFNCNTDEPLVECDGFSEEPTLHFKSNSGDSFGIYYLNVRGIGDTIYSIDQNGINVPVDMNGDTMTYEFLHDSTSLGQLELSYEWFQQFCKDRDQLNLYFKKAKFTPNSTLPNVNTVTNGFKTALDTSFGYKSFLNNTLENRYLEIQLP